METVISELVRNNERGSLSRRQLIAGCEHFDKPAAIAAAKAKGVPILDTPDPAAFHVVDPDGYSVQIIDNSTRG